MWITGLHTLDIGDHPAHELDGEEGNVLVLQHDGVEGVGVRRPGHLGRRVQQLNETDVKHGLDGSYLGDYGQYNIFFI